MAGAYKAYSALVVHFGLDAAHQARQGALGENKIQLDQDIDIVKKRVRAPCDLR